ncbi:MAG: 3'(2'),5'-bisphosphate nucleotidase CysQ [Fibrobacter sp.]|nr:3'(2'),5'-bisphosphate nucleotidase CysQ [Fibrobacter sp.]
MQNPIPYGDLLPAIREASAKEMLYYNNGYDVQIKSDETPVTSADLASNRILVDALQKLYPEIPVVSEEFDKPNPEVLRNAFFLVDPLDGTSDFISGRKEFTVNVALVERGKVVLGIVAVPALNELFYGYRDRAFCTSLSDVELGNVKELHLSGRYRPFMPGRKPRVLVSVSHAEPQTEDHLRKIAGEEIPVGSSLKFLRIADGFADYYPRAVSLHEWDIAAGHGVLKAAGGNVYRFGTENEVEYGQKDFVCPPFEAY